MLLNADIWWSFSMVKFMKDSFQEGMQESGVGNARNAQVTELCSRPLRRRRFEIIKIYIAAIVNSPLLLRHFSFLTAISFKAGKTNITVVKSPGLFACETITFAEPFSGGKQVKVFASFGHSVNNQARGNGAAIWVESADRTQFRACIYEYSNGSNSTAEINWIALQSAPKGAQLGTTSLDSWTTGTECKKIDFPQVRSILL